MAVQGEWLCAKYDACLACNGGSLYKLVVFDLSPPARAAQAYTQHAVAASRELRAVGEGWAERNKVLGRWQNGGRGLLPCRRCRVARRATGSRHS